MMIKPLAYSTSNLKFAAKATPNPLALKGDTSFIELNPKSDEDVIPKLMRLCIVPFSENRQSKLLKPMGGQGLNLIVSENSDHQHGGMVSGLGLFSTDPEQAVKTAEKLGFKKLQPNKQFPHHQYGIEWVGGTRLFFTPASDKKNPFKAGAFLSHLKPKAGTQHHHGGKQDFYASLDHVTLFVPGSEYESTIQQYEKIGFKRIDDYEIEGEYSGMKNYALKSPGGGLNVVIVNSDQDHSPINRHLSQHGTSYHHAAIFSNNLLQMLDLASQLYNNETPTMQISPEFYASQAFQDFPGVSPQDKAAIQRHNLVLSGEDNKKCVIQGFTKPGYLPNGFVVELIQRVNLSGFERQNVTALFKALELAMKPKAKESDSKA